MLKTKAKAPSNGDDDGLPNDDDQQGEDVGEHLIWVHFMPDSTVGVRVLEGAIYASSPEISTCVEQHRRSFDQRRSVLPVDMQIRGISDKSQTNQPIRFYTLPIRL